MYLFSFAGVSYLVEYLREDRTGARRQTNKRPAHLYNNTITLINFLMNNSIIDLGMLAWVCAKA